jgi:hypothetical protein
MTGYRIGYMAAPVWLVKACDKLQGQTTTGATTISQKAAAAALTGDQGCVTQMNVAFKRRKNLVVKMVREIPEVQVYDPDGAFYVFPKVNAFYGRSFEGTKINNSTDMCLYLLEKAHIATVPGDAFGDDDCIRISFATSDEKLVEAMQRMNFEDPTIQIEYSKELKQIILSGQGEYHLNIVKWHLDNIFKIGIEYLAPKIPYRETITKFAYADYRHKKQSGGAGQFGEVHMVIEPHKEGTPDTEMFKIDGKDRGSTTFGFLYPRHPCICL